MTDVFISYAREDRDWVEKLAASLEAEGVAVWWDRQLAGGMQFTKETEARLNAAKAIVVVWSKASVTSMWVGDEAVVGREKGNLVPVTIEPVAPTLGFRGIHTIDLVRWKGNRTAPEFVDLVRALKTFISGEVAPRVASVPRRPWLRRAPVLAAIGVGAAVLVAVGLFIFKPFGGLSMPGAGSATGGAARTLASSISIAVLPFDNFSGDASQDFFSDGMTEEITSALAKVSGLNVVARTSAFQFKGTKKDMRSIGQALGASYLIEGSFRKDGNEVRITAQLIKADDGSHLWTESYNRELKGVFAVQEEIATAIAGALRVPLGLKAGQSLVANRTEDTEAYQDYLRARSAMQSRGRARTLFDAKTLLEQVVKRDPNFAPAWATLSAAYWEAQQTDPTIRWGDIEEARKINLQYQSKSEEAARRAIQLDPNNAEGYAVLANALSDRRQFVAAEENLARALALDPQNTRALGYQRTFLAGTGHPKEALAVAERMRALDPFVPQVNGNLSTMLWVNGQNDAAIALTREWSVGAVLHLDLAKIYASMGRFREAADSVHELLKEMPKGALAPGVLETAERLLRAAPAGLPAPQSLPFLGYLSWAYLYTGTPERSLEIDERIQKTGSTNLVAMSYHWNSSYAAVRNTERFKKLIRDSGLVDYWRAKGWPEFCHPVGKDDFACH